MSFGFFTLFRLLQQGVILPANLDLLIEFRIIFIDTLFTITDNNKKNCANN